MKEITLYHSDIEDLNRAFIGLYTHWQQDPAPILLDRNTTYVRSLHGDEETGTDYGADITPKIRDWLIGHWLINDTKSKIFNQKENRNFTTHKLTATQNGREIYEKGRIYTVQIRNSSTPGHVGLGKNYPTEHGLWKIAAAMFEQRKAPQYVTQKWYTTFHSDKLPELLAIPTTDAEIAVRTFAQQCLSTWTPKRRQKATETDHANDQPLTAFLSLGTKND